MPCDLICSVAHEPWNGRTWACSFPHSAGTKHMDSATQLGPNTWSGVEGSHLQLGCPQNLQGESREGRQAGGREEFLGPLEPHTSESLAVLQVLLGICMRPVLPRDRREVWAV